MLPVCERLGSTSEEKTRYPIGPKDSYPDLLQHRWSVYPPMVFVHVAEPTHDLFCHLAPNIVIVLERIRQ